MREQTLTCDNAETFIREISFNETEMVGGGLGLPHINWGKVGHEAGAILSTAKTNIESHNWKDVAIGAGVGNIFAGPEGALVVADVVLAHQNGWI
jgi:hypothetical protein